MRPRCHLNLHPGARQEAFVTATYVYLFNRPLGVPVAMMSDVDVDVKT